MTLNLLQSPMFYLNESIRTNSVPTWLLLCILSSLIPVVFELELPLENGSHTFLT